MQEGLMTGTIIKVLIGLVLLSVMCRCGSTMTALQPERDTVIVQPMEPVRYPSAAGRPVGIVPHAHIYRTNGDYNNNVPVTLSRDRKSLVSFPAPSDVGAWAEPVALADGYLLDRRGVSMNTAFTSYTYGEYAGLDHAPLPEELLEKVIAGARVTELVELPFTLAVAESDTARVDSLIAEGLPGCKIVFREKAVFPAGERRQ